MMSKQKTAVSAAINAILFLATTAVVISYFFEEPGPLIRNGFESFKFFTTDSNVLAALGSLVILICDILVLTGKSERLPRWAILFKLIGTVSILVTFTTVLFLLIPYYGLGEMLGGKAFHMHFAAPIMSFLSLILLEQDSRLPKKAALLGLLPTILYGTVYLTEVVIIGQENGGWWDFYQFNAGGRWYLSIILMLLLTFILGFVTILLYNIGTPKNKNKLPAKQETDTKKQTRS